MEETPGSLLSEDGRALSSVMAELVSGFSSQTA